MIKKVRVMTRPKANTLDPQGVVVKSNLEKIGIKHLKKVSIGQNVWVGASCNLLAGTRVEDNSIISANSTVKSHIPPKTIYSLDKHVYKITKII